MMTMQANPVKPIASLLLFFTLAIATLQGQQLAPNSYFPVLTLPTSRDNELVSTESFRGKKSLIHIFASW